MRVLLRLVHGTKRKNIKQGS